MSTLRVGTVLNQAGTKAPTIGVQSMVRLEGGNGFGSVNTRIRRFLTTVTNTGSDIVYVDDASYGASFEIQTDGVYAISYTDNPNAAGDVFIGLNTTTGTTTPTNLREILAVATVSNTSYRANAAWTGYLPAGSQIRAYLTTPQGGSNQVFFTIARVS